MQNQVYDCDTIYTEIFFRDSNCIYMQGILEKVIYVLNFTKPHPSMYLSKNKTRQYFENSYIFLVYPFPLTPTSMIVSYMPSCGVLFVYTFFAHSFSFQIMFLKHFYLSTMSTIHLFDNGYFHSIECNYCQLSRPRGLK